VERELDAIARDLHECFIDLSGTHKGQTLRDMLSASVSDLAVTEGDYIGELFSFVTFILSKVDCLDANSQYYYIYRGVCC
jgi:hypothetical protein